MVLGAGTGRSALLQIALGDYNEQVSGFDQFPKSFSIAIGIKLIEGKDMVFDPIGFYFLLGAVNHCLSMT